MSEITPPKSDYRSENSEMAFTAEAVRDEMRQHVESIVALVPESRKAALQYAAKLLGLPFGRVRSLYYGEARRIDAHEADKVRAYVTAAQELIDARAAYETLRQSYLANAHPSLVRFAPGKLRADEVSEEAEAVTKRAVGE